MKVVYSLVSSVHKKESRAQKRCNGYRVRDAVAFHPRSSVHHQHNNSIIIINEIVVKSLSLLYFVYVLIRVGIVI